MISQKLRDAWRQNKTEEMVELLQKYEGDIELLRPVLFWCYQHIKNDIEDPNGSEVLEYWDNALVTVCNLVRQLPNHDENVKWKNCWNCEGTGKYEPYKHLGGFPLEPCNSCDSKGGYNYPLENHKMRLWVNLVRVLSPKGWFAWLHHTTGWKRSNSHGLCLWGEWGYVDAEIKYSEVKEYDGVKCGKVVPQLPEVTYKSVLRVT